jgi:DNA-binding transcriptional MerR regulator
MATYVYVNCVVFAGRVIVKRNYVNTTLISDCFMPNYTITELAREFDLTPRAIRFYEDQGLLSPKREGAGGRTRVYTARERTRLKLTLRGKRLGLTLSEIKDLVDMYESPKDSNAQLKRFLAVLAQHRETLERQREDIEVMLAEIAAHEEECRHLLGDGKSGRAIGRSANVA